MATLILKPKLERPKKASSYFTCHAHSEFSVLDGMPKVADMVQRAVLHGQPALALTDHGIMSGSVRLYKECKKAGILPFPGIEAYLVTDVYDKVGLLRRV